MMKVIIAGGREFTDKEVFANCVNRCLARSFENGTSISVISGCARGADTLAIKYAFEFDLNCIKMPADWDRYGKSAGYKRNEEMAKIGTHLIAFWDGKSRGTMHMINLAERYGLMIRIFDYSGKRIHRERG